MKTSFVAQGFRMVQNQDYWAQTPTHLVDLIFAKLGTTIRERLQFGVVCERWHSVFKENKKKLRNSNHHNRIPMLLVPDKRDPGAWRAYDVTTEKFPLPIIFPLSPEDLSQEFIDDGGLDFGKYHDYHINKVLITADPLENPDQCFVVTNFEDMNTLVFTKVTSPSWTLIPDSTHTDDMMLYGTRLYSIHYFGEIYSFNLEDPYRSRLELVNPGYHIDYSRPLQMAYLLQSPDKKVYVVRRHFDCECEQADYAEFTEEFEIFRLNLDTGELNEVSSIEDNVIFLGDNSSIFAQAASRCDRNCIYFTHNTSGVNGFGMCKIMSNVGVYHIPSKRFKYHPILNVPFFRNFTRSAPIWVEPTLNLY